MDEWLSSLSRRDMLTVTAGGLLLPQAALAAPKPKRGGQIRVACLASSTADTLDPAKGGLSTDYVRHFMLYSGLTQFDRQMRARPALAEAMESDDWINWTIKLRRGVTFHNGKAFDAEDVVYSLLRHKDPATGSGVKEIADQFVSAKAVGKHEVQLRLSGANADLPAMLATSHFLIVEDGAKAFKTANGTGPYRLKLFKPGVRTIVVRNGDYWKPGRPYLDQVEVIGIPDEVSRVNALLSGDVHLINALNPRSTRRIGGGHGVMETKSGLYTDLIMRQDQHPTGNPDFVLAMKYLIDRDLVRRAIFRGYATIANDHPIPPTSPYFNKDLPQRPHDPDRARFHLKRAGLTGVRLPMYCSPAAEGSVDMASVLQEYGARIGLKLAVNRVPSDGYWSNHWKKHPLSFGNTNPRPTADLLFSLFYKSDAPWNESGWKNEKFDRILLEARGERDEARRKQLYGYLQYLVHSKCGVSIPVFISNLDGYDRRLKGLSPIPVGGMMGYNFADHVWWDGA